MKHLKTFFAFMLMAVLSIGQVRADNAAVGATLWAEDFGHFGTNTPSSAGTGTGTTIYGDATITYTQSSTNTKGYNEKLAGGTAPELLLAKSNTTWTISGIPTGGATEMALSFKSNKTTFAVTTSTANLSISGSAKAWTITVDEGKDTPASFDLVIKNSGSANARLDDVALIVVTAASEGGSGDPTLSSISVATAPTKITYTEGEYFDPTGLVITRNYSNSTSDTYTYADHTSDFSFSPSTSTALTTSNTSVTITYGGQSTTQAITVNAASSGGQGGGSSSGNFSWDLSKATYTTGTNEVTWSGTYATMHNSGTNATNYLGEDANNRTSSRFYKDNTLTITPAEGISISSVEFTATSESYATTLQSSKWTNASAAVASTTVTVTPTNGANAISATVGGTCGFTNVKVYYTTTGGSGGGEATNPTISKHPASASYAVGATPIALSVSATASENGGTLHYQWKSNTTNSTEGATNVGTDAATYTPSTVSAGTTYYFCVVSDDNGSTNSNIATIDVVAPLTTMQAIFSAATSTATDQIITFSNTWVVTGISTNGKNAYLTDGEKGLILFNNSASDQSPVAGLAAGNTLSGTVTRSLVLYSGAAELKDFTAEGLTKGTADLPAVQELDAEGIAALTGANTGSLIKISGKGVVDGTKYYIKYGSGDNDKVQVYNTLYAFDALTANANYECTGVYVQYNNTKEIAPRSAADLVKEVEKSQPNTYWDGAASGNMTVRANESIENLWTTASTGTKHFSTSDNTIATIANDGAITLVGGLGNVVLTYTTDADDNYYAGEATLTLNVKAALPVGGTEFTWDATKQSYNNEQVLTTVTASPDPVIVFAKGGQNDNKYYTSTSGGPAVRFYKDNSITVTAPDNKLLYQIEINFVSGYVKTLTTDVETYNVEGTVGTWSGMAKEVIFSNGDGAARLTSISVTYADGTVTELEIANVAMKTTDNPLTIVPKKHNPSSAPIEYTIASEDQQYATIENGVITPHKVTTTPITVTASIAAGSNYTAASTTFTITVANKAVPTLSFPKDSYNANLGEDFTEPVLTKPEGVTVKYSSSDASVSVDENTGAITLNTEGSAVITVTSVENDDYAVASTSYTLIVTDPNKDVLTAALIGNTSYADWSDKTFGSSVKYTGNSTTGTNDNAGSIQMRKSSGTQAKSGIVTTSAIGYLKSISATRKSGTNYLDVYAKNTAYTSVEDLYNSETQGTLIGTIASGAMTFADGKAYSDNYKYIGIISHSGAVYYDDITIKWTPIEFTSYTVTYNAGEVSADPVVESVEEGSVISLKAANTFTAPEGKIFAGWKLDGEENVREAGSNFTVTAAATFVAQWISVYTITYTAGEGTGDDVIVPNVQAGNYELAENTFTAPSNKEFEGWKLNNTGDLLEAGANYNVTGNASFTAQWSVVKQAAGLAYATTSYIITRGNSFNAPVLTNPHSLAVTYSGNNDEVATVDAQSGAITLQGASGEVTITAISAATDYYYAGEASYTLKVKDGNLAGGWVRLTSSNGLVNGMKVIIAQHVSSGTDIKAMGAQNTNNRAALAGALEDGKLAADEGTAIFTLEAVGDNYFAFKTTDGKYLYAASSSQNYLKSQAKIDGNATWAITLGVDGTATITAQGDNTRNVMRYNSNNGLFSCYTSGQQDIAIYSKTISVISGELEASTLEDYADVVVEEGAKLVIDESAANKPLGNISGDVEVNAPLQAEGVHLGVNNTMTINSTVTTPSFSISVQLGSTGQGTNVNVNTGGSIASPLGYVDMQLSDNANPDHWHSFTVPFEVDALNGIYDANTGMKLQNEVNYAIMDYHGDVRANGQYGWKKYRGTLQPGTFYLITIDGESKALRFIKKEGSGYIADNRMEMTYYDGSGTSTDFGWCGVGNQNMFNGYVPQAYVAQVLNATGTAYEPINANAALSACIPFFIQVNVTVNLVMQTTAPTLAPLRMPASNIERVQVTFGNEAYSDNLYITASEDALNEYEIGKDLVKMTVSNTPNVAQIFGKAYNNKLCVVNAPLYNNQATYDLTLYAPAAGEYTISAPQMEDVDVYLTLNGAVLWNISMSPYTLDLQKGNTEDYGLLLQKHNAPQVVTGVDNIDDAAENAGVQKVILNDHVYILRNGQRYDVTGKLAK